MNIRENKILKISDSFVVIDISTRQHSNYQTIFDQEELEKLLKYHWHVDIDRHRTRVRSSYGVAMSRIILNAPDDIEVDHINGNGLINIKSNLRLCSHADNMKNIHLNLNDGVSISYEKGAYRIKVALNGKHYHHKRFKNKEDALEAYTKLANARALL